MKLLGLFVMPAPLHGHWRGYFIPDDLATRLSGVVPRPREETLAAVPEPVPVRADLSLVVAETEDAATREIFSALQLIDRGGVSVSAQTRRPAQKGVDAVREILVGGDFVSRYRADEPMARGHRAHQSLCLAPPRPGRWSRVSRRIETRADGRWPSGPFAGAGPDTPARLEEVDHELDLR